MDDSLNALPHTMQARLDLKRQGVTDARRKLETLEAELRGFEEAVRFMSVPMGRETKPSAAASDLPGRVARDRQSGGHAPGDGRRPISEQWRGILKATADIYPQAVSLDDIQVIAERLGTPTNRNTLRSQVAIYTDRGLMERVSQGHYRLTSLGAAQVGATLPATIGPDAPPGLRGGGLGAIFPENVTHHDMSDVDLQLEEPAAE